MPLPAAPLLASHALVWACCEATILYHQQVAGLAEARAPRPPVGRVRVIGEHSVLRLSCGAVTRAQLGSQWGPARWKNFQDMRFLDFTHTQRSPSSHPSPTPQHTHFSQYCDRTVSAYTASYCCFRSLASSPLATIILRHHASLITTSIMEPPSSPSAMPSASPSSSPTEEPVLLLPHSSSPSASPSCSPSAVPSASRSSLRCTTGVLFPRTYRLWEVWRGQKG